MLQECEQRLREACDVLERRLRAGQSYRTEDCLAAHPELAADGDAMLELLYFEYLLREELGEELSAEDWYRRFPEQQSSFEKILQIHRGTSVTSHSGGLSAALATSVPLQTLPQRKAPAARRLSKYELLEELGRGSMGVVYKAREPALDRMVAVKVVLAGAHAGLDQLVRVHREGRAIARLQHPNIVQIHEIGEDDGRPFLCMEYVNGPGLDRLLARWNEQGNLGLTPQAAARLLESLARAVHYAHQQGIIHRDLKPANILLQSAGHGVPIGKGIDLEWARFDWQSVIPKIADFGLAKFLDGSADATQTGHLVGTPSFMAPEQADGRIGDVGPAVDVYALGVILYQLLTGRPPFQAQTVQETLELVRTAEPTPPRQLQPHLPHDLQTICLKCLAKEPGSRYASALALAEDLGRFLAGEPIWARATTLTNRLAKWVKRRPIVAGLLVALLLTIGAGGTSVIWQWQRAEQNAAAAEQNARNFKQERDIAIEERGRAQRHLQRARESIDELARLGDQLFWSQPELNKTGKSLLEKVLAFYQEVLKDESTDPSIRLRTAEVWGRVARFRETLGEWDRAVEDYRHQSGMLEVLLREEPDSILYCERLGESLRRRAHVLRDMGKMQQARDAYQEAARLEEQVLATAPANPSYQAALANTLVNQATVLSSKKDAQEIEKLHQRAIELIKSALKTHPGNTGYESELALYLEGLGSFYWNRGQGAQAEETSRAGLEIRERHRKLGQLNRETERYLGRAYSDLGLIVAGRGRSMEAEAIYGQSADLLGRLRKEYPDWIFCRDDLVRTRMRQGALQVNLGNHHQAGDHFRQAVQLDPNGAGANNALAWFLATCPEPSLRQAHEAIRLAKKAVAAQPHEGNYWNTLGVAHYRDGDCNAAIETLRKAMKLHAGCDGYDWFFLAMAHWKLGDREEARRCLAEGVQWLPKDEIQNEELARFQAEAQALMRDSATPVRPSNTPPSDK